MKYLDSATGKRLIDFICGTAYAISGHMLKIAENIFLFTPSHVLISNSEQENSFSDLGSQEEASQLYNVKLVHESDKLKEIVKRLRAPDGCPWDIEQTFQSLTPHIIEEAYELVDAIEFEDVQHFKEELGDVLLHVVMLPEMPMRRAGLSLDDVKRCDG